MRRLIKMTILMSGNAILILCFQNCSKVATSDIKFDQASLAELPPSGETSHIVDLPPVEPPLVVDPLSIGPPRTFEMYIGKFSDPDGYNFFDFKANKEVVHMTYRQVGRNGTNIPYPTICGYIMHGKLVSENVHMPITRGNIGGYVIQDIRVDYTEIELTNLLDKFHYPAADTLANENCRKHQENVRNTIQAAGKIQYDYSVEFVSQSGFIITLPTSGSDEVISAVQPRTVHVGAIAGLLDFYSNVW